MNAEGGRYLRFEKNKNNIVKLLKNDKKRNL